MGLRPGDKVLVDGAAPDEPVKWLLAPLVAGASIVVVANLPPGTIEERRLAEGATHTV